MFTYLQWPFSGPIHVSAKKAVTWNGERKETNLQCMHCATGMAAVNIWPVCVCFNEHEESRLVHKRIRVLCSQSGFCSFVCAAALTNLYAYMYQYTVWCELLFFFFFFLNPRKCFVNEVNILYLLNIITDTCCQRFVDVSMWECSRKKRKEKNRGDLIYFKWTSDSEPLLSII